jgi:acyl carrier protein
MQMLDLLNSLTKWPIPVSNFSIEDRVTFVLENLVMPGWTINRESTWEQLGFDSLDKIDFLMDIEDEFNVSIPDEAMELLDNVGEVIQLLERLSEK